MNLMAQYIYPIMAVLLRSTLYPFKSKNVSLTYYLRTIVY